MQIRCLAQKRFCPGSYQPGGTPITCCLAWVPGGSSAAATALSTGRPKPGVAIFASWAVVDAYGQEEQAMDWYYYLEDRTRFPKLPL